MGGGGGCCEVILPPAPTQPCWSPGHGCSEQTKTPGFTVCDGAENTSEARGCLFTVHYLCFIAFISVSRCCIIKWLTF